jgi:hypothetical protein
MDLQICIQWVSMLEHLDHVNSIKFMMEQELYLFHNHICINTEEKNLRISTKLNTWVL